MRLSIIVPAYNVADLIERCIRSLENQDIPENEYEIIVTNDGSPDNCQEIIEKLQCEFSNIVLINQENQGVSAARNNAMAIAKGEFIMPIDPDDYVVPNCMKNILERAVRDNLDVVFAAFEIFDEFDKSVWRANYAHLVKRIHIGFEGYFAVRGANVRDPDRSVAILYRAAMLKEFQISYPTSLAVLEDGLFLIKVLAVAERVGYSNLDFYQRTTRIGSAINSNLFNSDRAISGFIQATIDLEMFRKKHEFHQNQLELINHGIANFVLLSLFPSVKLGGLKTFRKTCKKLKQLGYSKIEILGVRDVYRSYSRAFNVSPFLFLILYSKVKIKVKFFNK
jgi:glycosyltransferase involved in cell wall biosynthesis